MTESIDSRQLVAFATLARTGSFTRTAERLFLSQSAISHAIKNLETELGCSLLNRQGKKIHLTEAGETLLARADRILAEMAEARRELADLNDWGQGRLRVGASASSCQYILPAVIREFKESFPECAVIIHPADTPASRDLLRRNEIDLALCLEPENDREFAFRELFSDEMRYLVSPRHPWARAGCAVRDQISKQRFILYNKASLTFRMVAEYFSREGLQLHDFVELGSQEAIKELVKIGMGVGITASWVVRKELEDGSLVMLPLGRRKLRRTWGIGHLRQRRLSLAEETFAGLCEIVTKDIEEVRSLKPGATRVP